MANKTIGLTKEIIAARKKAEADRKKAAKANAGEQSPDNKKSEE